MKIQPTNTPHSHIRRFARTTRAGHDYAALTRAAVTART